MLEFNFRIKILCLIFSYSFLAVSLISCAQDPVKTDLVDYMNNDILRISELESMSLYRYSLVTGENYKSDEEIKKVLKNYVIPQYGRFVSALEKIHPFTEETRSVHQIYLEGADQLYSGFKMMLIALDKRDPVLFQRANANVQNGRIEVNQWREAFIDLCNKHGVKIEMMESR